MDSSDLSMCRFMDLRLCGYTKFIGILCFYVFCKHVIFFAPLSPPCQVNLKHHLFEVQTEIVEKVALEDGAGVFRLIREQKVTNQIMFWVAFFFIVASLGMLVVSGFVCLFRCFRCLLRLLACMPYENRLTQLFPGSCS